jgi:aminoglycoside phosphotransferase (APT) family kinase protein
MYKNNLAGARNIVRLIQRPDFASISNQPVSDQLDPIIQAAFACETVAAKQIGSGAFGLVYLVTLPCSPERVVVKIQKFPGWGLREKQQLEYLRQYAPVPVPQIYYYQPDTANVCEALMMEYIPGVPGKSLRDPAPPIRQRITRDIIETLLALHEVQHPGGYGNLNDSSFYAYWWDFYGQRVRAVHAYLQRPLPGDTPIDTAILRMADRSLSAGERIFAECQNNAVLVHGDFCLNNLLFDPTTSRIVGLIDPLDLHWGERELDLVNLTKSRGDRFQLLETYSQSVDLGEQFPLRYWFYQFWSWLYYYALIHVLATEWLLFCVQKLEEAMKKYLL